MSANSGEADARPDGGHASSPLPPYAALRLVGAAVTLAMGLCLVGLLVVDVLGPAGLTRWEDRINEGAVAGRTPRLDILSSVGSRLSDTITCIALLIVMMLVLRWWLGRWRESFVLAAAIVGELLVFLVVTFLVQRDRPDVPKLDAAPPTSSFPSGHTAAAVAIYGCIAFVVWRRMRNRAWATVIVVLCCAVPVIVGISRIYRGMHHPSDVLFGLIGGGIWLLVVVAVLLPPRDVDVSFEQTELGRGERGQGELELGESQRGESQRGGRAEPAVPTEATRS